MKISDNGIVSLQASSLFFKRLLAWLSRVKNATSEPATKSVTYGVMAGARP